jgi:glycine cleavage system H protein
MAEAQRVYAKSHEWVAIDGDTATVGISSYAQDSLGDVVFVELPAVGATVQKGSAFGVVESVKAASDVFSPVNGEVVEVNGDLEDSPGVVNEDPIGRGWFMKVRVTDPSDVSDLMDEDSYRTYTEGLDEE